MEFSVIIPVYNAGQKIAVTLQSLLTQSSVLASTDSFSCIVVDGASTDDTLTHVKKLADDRISVISEPDHGMYDALAKGLARAGGDITCYLPAGEQFDPQAFSIVSQIFDAFPNIHWLTGRAVTRNAQGQITDSLLPHPFRRSFIDAGFYGTRLPAIQQESTFWRTDLTRGFDLKALKKLHLAGDYFLWKTLASTHDLYVVNAHLGSFTIEPGQLSKSAPGGYRKELRTLRRRPALHERFHALIRRQITKRTLPNRHAKDQLHFDHETGKWILGAK